MKWWLRKTPVPVNMASTGEIADYVADLERSMKVLP